MTVKLIRNARIHTPVDAGRPAAGKKQGAVRSFEPGALITRNGYISDIGPESEILKKIGGMPLEADVDCGGRCLIPGFVDPHTHICFAETREVEFGRRLSGTPYLEILKQGGGILSSVRSVREASASDLLERTLARARSALRFGTTTIEIKSGYGLDTATELKMFAVIDRVSRETPLDVAATFLGAHAVPAEFRKDSNAFVDLVVDEMLPAVVAQGTARFCDVFCEEGVFSIAQGRRILSAAKGLGLALKIHADEVHDLGGAALAAEMKATSADHLLAASDAGLTAMASAGVLGVLLPATAYSLRKPYARARRMVELSVPLALATDCNPGSSYTESMPFAFGLAVMNMALTPAEALTAATLNGAYAVKMADRVGSLDVGKQADFLLLEGESPAILAYHAGVSPVTGVYKKAEKVA